MRGAIHGIWLTKKNGSLHPAVIPNLESLQQPAAAADFQIMLWTNIEDLSKAELARLQQSHITVQNPKTCKDSPLFMYYNYFLQKGLKGDTTAFALASDILRMAILDFTADDKYFIYIDPNDIALQDLANSLHNIDIGMKKNPLGFAFPIGPVTPAGDVFEMRNDVLIALKAQNPQFFKQYLTAYWGNLEHNYKKYHTPKTSSDAKLMENLISNDISMLFFRLEKANNSVDVIAQFGKYQANYQNFNCNNYLKYSRIVANGNNWLLDEKNYSIAEEIQVNNTYLEILKADQNASIAANKNLTKTSQYIPAFIGTTIGLLLVVVFLFLRNQKRSTKHHF